MTTTPFRRPRGTKKDAVPVFVEVSPEAARVLEKAHIATGAPKWVVVEHILMNLALDENNLPEGWPHGVDEQGELPIKHAI